MDVSISSRRRKGIKNGGGGVVAAGSVWETRMKQLDHHVELFKSTHEKEEKKEEEIMDKKVNMKPKQSHSGKRKTWKSEKSSNIEAIPFQIATQKSNDEEYEDQESKSDHDGVDFNCKEFDDVCHEKVIITTTNLTTLSQSQAQYNQELHRKLQSLVDLVMWKDVLKSAFIFGIGTFIIIISSLYTQEFNISIISALSYIGLVYVASIFIFSSLKSKGAKDINGINQEDVVKEEEAIWLIKIILPYVNQFFLNLRPLFSGDPITTIKVVLLLLFLAKCGSINSITIIKMAKLGFLGVFVVPKICSSYSNQITAYGTLWIHRSQDTWRYCYYKKIVVVGIFALVWHLSSIVTRVWEVFMLFVAFKYYQQSLIRDRGLDKEEAGPREYSQGQRKEYPSTLVMET